MYASNFNQRLLSYIQDIENILSIHRTNLNQIFSDMIYTIARFLEHLFLKENESQIVKAILFCYFGPLSYAAYLLPNGVDVFTIMNPSKTVDLHMRACEEITKRSAYIDIYVSAKPPQACYKLCELQDVHVHYRSQNKTTRQLLYIFHNVPNTNTYVCI
jgi:hypothetical protein